jgi:outer membrane receptor protein involved in Fe transport
MFGGNTNLRPETSNTFSIGGVFTPTFIDGFSATIDYFNIKVKGLVAVFPQQVVVQDCAFSGDPAFCGLIHRSAQGLLFGTGPGAGYVTSLNVNTGYLQTSGIDFEANYQADLQDWGMGSNGSLAFNLVGSLMNEYEVQPFTGGSTYDCAGLFGPVCGTSGGLASPVYPKWRHKLRVTWASPWDVDISLAWRYISAVTYEGNQSATGPNASLASGLPFDPVDARISPYNYFDLSASWTVRSGVDLRAGVTNIFDKQPPIVDTNNLGVSAPPFGNGNTFPQVYDALGRVIYVGATLKY